MGICFANAHRDWSRIPATGGVLQGQLAHREARRKRDFQNGKYTDGDARSYYAAMAPDGGISKAESIRRHLNAWGSTPATFYCGGMTFNMVKSGSNIIVKVTDAYTVMSMIRVNATINRIPGQVTPLGKITVEFNFIWRDVNFAAKEQK